MTNTSAGAGRGPDPPRCRSVGVGTVAGVAALPAGRHARRRRPSCWAGRGHRARLVGTVIIIVPDSSRSCPHCCSVAGTAMFLQVRRWESTAPCPLPDAQEPAAPAANSTRRATVSAWCPARPRWIAVGGPRTTRCRSARTSPSLQDPRRIDLAHRGWTGADMISSPSQQTRRCSSSSRVRCGGSRHRRTSGRGSGQL
jgi:hypothetical protein